MGVALVTSNPGIFGFFAFGDQPRGVVAIGSAPIGVRGIGVGIGLDVAVIGWDPELVGELPPEGMRRGWWAKVLVLSMLVAGAVGVAWSAMPTDAKVLTND